MVQPIKKEDYDKLYEAWVNRVGSKKIYQTKKRVFERIPHFCQYLDVLNGKDVLEIGCNAGLHAYHIAQAAKSYTGLEPGTGYWKQAQETQKIMDNENVAFINGTISDYVNHAYPQLTTKPNAFVACFAMYHFEDFEIDLLDKDVWPGCDTVYIQNRQQPRFTKHNSYKLWESKNVMKFFNARGFSCELHWGPNKKFAEIIGKRNED